MTLEKFLRSVAIIGIFALPFVAFIVASNLFFPYITGKNFTFRIIVEIMVSAWVGLALLNAKYRPHRNVLLYAFAAFIAVIALANAQGVYPFKSFWSNYERMDGWVTIAHLFAYFVVASSVMHAENLWKRLWQTSVGSSVILSLYGLLQVVGVLAIGQGGSGGLQARVDATFGNPIYFAVYMLFNMFIAALLIAQSRERDMRGRASIFLRRMYAAVIIFDLMAMLFSGTRGAVVGLVGGILVTSILIAYAKRHVKNVRYAAIGTLAALIIVVGGFWTVRDTPFVSDIGFLRRLATISTTDETTKARFINWQTAWEGVKEKPILGWGQENFAIVFDKYYDPRMYAQEQWFDRVHNIVFDWLVAGGIVGLLAYVSIFVSTLWLMWRGKLFTVTERSLLTGLLVAYSIHNFFVFDNVTSYILFGTVLAYIAWRYADAHGGRTVLQSFELPRGNGWYVGVGSTVLAVLLVWSINANAYAANVTLLSGLVSNQGGPERNLAAIQSSIAYRSYGMQEAREQLAQLASQAASSQVSNEVKQKFFDVATTEMAAQAAMSPLDARFPFFQAMLLDAFGDHTDAAEAYATALRLSPMKQTIMYAAGNNALMRGDAKTAVGYFKQAYEVLPENDQAFQYYVGILIRTGDTDAATALVEERKGTAASVNPMIISSYASAGDYRTIIELESAYIASHTYVPTNPADAQAYGYLASAYYALGDTEKAIETVNALMTVDPAQKKQGEQMIEQIRSGTLKVQ